MVHVDVMNNSSSLMSPNQHDIKKWVEMSVGLHRSKAEVSLLIVDEKEGAELNRQWRGKEGPTNVLSFPSDLPPELKLPLLGDIIICAPVVEREAKEQKKSIDAHWAHMIVHGTLHLLGYDHVDDNEADKMESLEEEILSKIGYPDPYRKKE